MQHAMRHVAVRVDERLRQWVPNYRKRRKYGEELSFWRQYRAMLQQWWAGERDYWGLPPVTDSAQRISTSSLWVTNAVLTLHAVRPTYLEELQLERDAFAGNRVLEVGCGPLVPLLQFSDCERHGLDPLASVYMEAGWPLYDYDAHIVAAHGERMPYPDGYFDTVISVNALDHVDDFEQVAAEIQRVVRPGGRLFFDIEYHAPTVSEPHRLSDDRVRAAFARTDLQRVCERGKRELFQAITTRFGLLPAVFANFGNDERFVCWHGVVRS